MSTLKNKSKSELIEIIESLEMQVQEFKSNEDILQESEEKFTKTFNSSPSPMIISEIETGNIIDVNRSFENMIMYSREELIRKNVLELNLWVNPKDRKKYIKKMKDNKRVSNLEVELRTKSGDIIATLISGEILTIKEKPYLLTSGTDISERKMAQFALEESERRLALAVKVADLGLWDQDFSNGEIIRSDRWASMLGYNMNEISNNILGWKNLIHPDDLPVAEQVISEHERGKSDSFNIEHRMLTKDRKWKWIQNWGKIIERTPDGKPLRALGAHLDITERKQMEEALRKSEEQYRILVNQTPAVLWTSDQNGETSFISSNVEQVYGYTAEEILRSGDRFWFGRIHPEDLSDVTAAYEELLKSGKPYNIEYRIQRRDGNWIWLHDRALRNYEAEGTLRADGIFWDITEQKKAEEELRESERKFREMADLLPQIIYETDLQGNITFVNKQAYSKFGYSVEDIKKDFNVLQVVIPNDRDRAKENMNNIMNGKTADNTEYTVARKDGSTFPVVIYSSPVLKDKQPIGLRGIIIDITERKEAESALKESEAKFRLLFEAAAEGILVANLKTKDFIYANSAICSMLGYTRDELLNLDVSDIHPLESLDSVIAEFEAQARGERTTAFDIPCQRKDGSTIYTNISTTKMKIQDQECNVGYFTNITERKQVEKILQESEEKFSKSFYLSPDSISLSSVETGKLIEINKGFEKIFGYTMNEAIGKSTIELGLWTNPKDRDKMIEIMKKDGNVRNFESVGKSKSGNTFIGDISSGFIEISGEKCLLTIVRDITEHKQAEEALRKSEERFRRLAENSPDVIYRHRLQPNLGFEYISPSIKEISGYKPQEHYADPELGVNIIHPDDRLDLEDFLSGKFFNTLHVSRWRHKNGSTVWIEDKHSPVYDEKGNIVAVEGIARDITDRIKAEKRIEFLRYIIEQITDSVLATDLNYKIKWVNKAFFKLFGYSSKEVLNRTPDFLNAEPIAEEIQGEIYNAVSSGNTWKGEVLNKKKDGAIFPCELLIYPLRDKNGDIFAYAGHQRDITERKKADQKLRESRNQLRSLAERLQIIREEERATIAREIHDDLGQTLTALKMDISWMKKNPGLTEEMRVKKIDTMLGLTDSTIQTVKRIATDLRPGILDDLGLVSAIEWQTKEFQNRSGIECNFEIFADEFTVEDDISIAVFRIFQESLTNIARHSQATKVTVTISRADDFFLVEISDNGVGINEEQINSSKSLGLVGMNERVSVFGGKLTISRAGEDGTDVRVYIPVGKT